MHSNTDHFLPTQHAWAIRAQSDNRMWKTRLVEQMLVVCSKKDAFFISDLKVSLLYKKWHLLYWRWVFNFIYSKVAGSNGVILIIIIDLHYFTKCIRHMWKVASVWKVSLSLYQWKIAINFLFKNSVTKVITHITVVCMLLVYTSSVAVPRHYDVCYHLLRWKCIAL